MDIVETIISNLTIKVLERFVKKKSNIWVFGMDEGGGTRFAGNVWYLYEYCVRNCPNIQAICITSSDFVMEHIHSIGGVSCKPNSIKSIRTSLYAKVSICAYETHIDLVNFSKHNTIKVNLWHGMILKKIGYASPKMIARRKNRSLLTRVRWSLQGEIRFNEYDFIPCTSINFIQPMVDTFNTTNIFVTGQPRDDAFFLQYSRKEILEKYDMSIIAGKKIVTYLPTTRDVRKNDKNYFIFESSQRIRKSLSMNDIVVLQKNHHTDIETMVQNECVYNLSDNINTQELLLISDILITDYSSCYFDYLHTSRPIIFYPYDLQEYLKEDRELYFDYVDNLITPGIKAYNEDELYKAIEKYHNHPEYDAEYRNISKAYFHNKSDGNSSKRNYEAIRDFALMEN